MAFTDYKNFVSIKAKYPAIKVQSNSFIPENLVPIVVSPYLQEEITTNLKIYRSNEFLASENLVTPLLRAAYKPYIDDLNYWSHQAIRYDDDLSGTPDYMFTHLEEAQYELLSYPIITSVEAKAENFVEGWSQCIVQMLACQKLNNKPDVTIFGIVTTGKQWEFGKMQGDIVSKHPINYGIDNLSKLLAILDYILSEAKKQINSK